MHSSVKSATDPLCCWCLIIQICCLHASHFWTPRWTQLSLIRSSCVKCIFAGDYFTTWCLIFIRFVISWYRIVWRKIHLFYLNDWRWYRVTILHSVFGIAEEIVNDPGSCCGDNWSLTLAQPGVAVEYDEEGSDNKQTQNTENQNLSDLYRRHCHRCSVNLL